MASTVTIPPTLQTKLDKAEPGNLADVLRQVKLGTMLTPRKKTLTALAAAAAHNITDAAHGSLAPILKITALRVTAGAATAGARIITDSAALAAATVAALSDDGTTLTFEDTVTAFVLEYIPRSAVDMTALNEFAPTP
jgi:hypothetical protein